MKTTLRIERLVLRTRGLTSAEAQSTAQAIGPALAESLNAKSTPRHLPEVQVTLPASAASSPMEMARQIAQHVASARP